MHQSPTRERLPDVDALADIDEAQASTASELLVQNKDALESAKPRRATREGDLGHLATNVVADCFWWFSISAGTVFCVVALAPV
jgi:hypothetical protein